MVIIMIVTTFLVDNKFRSNIYVIHLGHIEDPVIIF